VTPILRAQTDQRLVELVRHGNDRAFETIVVRYRKALLRYCSSIVPGGRAEDAVQQTLLRAYDSLRASEGEMQLRPWLYRIAHNQSLNALRDRSLGHEELDESIDGVQRPDQAFEGNERLRDVLAAVSALPVRQRDAIVLRELEGRSYEEIAAELGVTGGAVRQLLNRARGTLRAGATALTPIGLLTRIPGAAEGSEILSGTIAAKAAATALVTGAVVGGVAGSPDSGTSDGRADSRPREERAQPAARTAGPSPGPVAPAAVANDDAESSDGDSGRGRGRGRGGDDDPDEDHSGRRGGETETEEPEETEIADDDNSGPGSGSSGSGHDGSPDADSSGSGSSGSGSSGSGSSGSGSGSSGSSGSGLLDSDVDSSGSGSGG
jgi:RNA polymerase sigma factor (sigma-70 family)